MEMAAMAEMEATAKAQAFAHRLVEFADAAACVSFLETRGVDLDRPNADGWSVLMSACACGASASSPPLSPSRMQRLGLMHDN
jgi:ankyrin repeat protein